MSPFSLAYLTKLRELKLWQDNCDTVLHNDSQQSLESNTLGSEFIEGISTLDNPKYNSSKFEDWTKKTISLSSPFDQKLEGKLVEEHVKAQNKPKKPFLKKGSGLLRYKLYNPTKIKPVKKSKINTKTELTVQQSISLKDPIIKPKATWCEAVLTNTNSTENKDLTEENEWVSKLKLKDNITEQIKELTVRNIFPNGSMKQEPVSKK